MPDVPPPGVRARFDADAGQVEEVDREDDEKEEVELLRQGVCRPGVFGLRLGVLRPGDCDASFLRCHRGRFRLLDIFRGECMAVDAASYVAMSS